jgi:ComF family protein
MNNALLNLFFPKVCAGCNVSLFSNEYLICTKCLANLPETNYHQQPGNVIEKIFWGRVKVEHAFAFLLFRKHGITQNLLHQLKYKGIKEIGTWLGKLYATRLQELSKATNIDGVAAIPLHRSKLLKRGYNQAQLFSEGLAEKLGVAEMSQNLIRNRVTETQTKKSRVERQDNVSGIFQVKDPDKLEGKHILLVDDVITTGATLESCVAELLRVPGCRVSVAALAYTG